MVRFQNILIFPIDFNDFIKLLGHLGATLGPTFIKNMEDNGRMVAKIDPNGVGQVWIGPCGAISRQNSPWGRPKRANLQKIHTDAKDFALPTTGFGRL